MRECITVLKFGGSVLRMEDDLAAGVHEVYRWLRQGRRVVAVVSAFEGTTDALVAKARSYTDAPGIDAHSLLLSTGECTTAALLCLALARAGVPARVLGPHALGLRTRGEGTDADPASIDLAALQRALREAPVVVVPGFIGAGADGNVTLLGRGGSDLTALFIAAELQRDTGRDVGRDVQCRLIKDVDGLYDRDPKEAGPAARRYQTLSWDDALTLDGGIVQHKAVRLARERGLSFEVAAFQREDCSRVGAHGVSWHDGTSGRPLRVAVLGCGTVGTGVVRHLSQHPSAFEVTGVVVRDAVKVREVPANVRITTDPDAALEKADVLVEVAGGADVAHAAVRGALERGLHVVTANKALLAAHGAELDTKATAKGVRLLRSASVGGSVPMLESVARVGADVGVASFEGVLNGTTNFVLERVRQGDAFDVAVRTAQRLGYAEADSTRDLDGTDAFEKLVLLCHAAFGAGADLSGLTRVGLVGTDPALLPDANRHGAVRLIAWAARDAEGVISGGVGPTLVPPGHAFHMLPGATNSLCVRDVQGGTHMCSGAGAGRWPTAESVMADLWDLRRLAGAEADAACEEVCDAA